MMCQFFMYDVTWWNSFVELVSENNASNNWRDDKVSENNVSNKCHFPFQE